jgi:catechol 2,3-dioxygenase-like lactoylglutathione lyase family enzyme
MKIDHIALQVENPKEAAEWYRDEFEGEILYADETWSFVQMENIKLAFVVKSQHPEHIAFEVDHRDGTISVYKRDPFGNIYELIKYPLDK